MDFKNFSDDQLVASLESEFLSQRRGDQNILLHLKEIQSRRVFAKRGYSDLYTMLIRHYKQSESSANQRTKALALMKDVPEVEDGIISGSLNMSVLAMAQRKILQQEKITGQKLSSERKSEVVGSIWGKTQAQAEIELFKQLPETASNPETHKRRVSEDATRMNLTIPNDVLEMMNRLQELWAHVDPSMDEVEIMRRAFTITLDQVDPLRKKSQRATESAKHRGNERRTYYGVNFDHELHTRSNSQCEYIDKKTGRRCECKFGLQREHIIPIALGGTNELSNMQLLCRTHNDLRARQVFGDQKIDHHQRQH